MPSIRRTPITAELLILCIAMWIGCSMQASTSGQSFAQVQRVWHAILDLDFSDVHDGVRRSKTPELHGPFDVWNGEWWRIPVTVFHHPDLMSLVLNLGATWYLGGRLERRWGSLVFALFLIPAICLPAIVELFFGNACMGLSGVACSILGVLLVLRHVDPEAEKEFSQDAAEIGIAIVFIGCLAGFSGLVSLPNFANLTGIAYGVSMAGLTSGALRKSVLLRATIILAHPWLVPALLLACHPYWVGRYHWYQAVVAKNPQHAERSLEHAVKTDRSLTGAWLRWAKLAEERGDQPVAWKRLIEGLAANPSNAPLIDSTRRLWRHLDLRERKDAGILLETVFGKRMGREWLNQVRAGSTTSPESSEDGVNAEETTDDSGQFSLDQKIELPEMNALRERLNPQNPKIQMPQNDAVEGESL